MSTATQESTQLLTVRDVAERLNVHVGTVYRMVWRGDLPALKLGDGKFAAIRFDERELEAWLRGEPGHPDPPGMHSESDPASIGGVERRAASEDPS